MARKPNEHLSIYLLKLAGIGVLFTVASVLAPQLPYLTLKHYLKKKFGAKYNNRKIGNSIRYLKRKKFIAIENRQNKLRIVLTKLGQKRLNRIALDQIKIQPHKWDHKWRLVMFDIPEEKKSARFIFRRKLKELNFVHFQRSVFLSPFKCAEEINKLADYLSILPFVYVLNVERFRNDYQLLKKFNIKLTDYNFTDR